jgi:hypothetical protein
LRFRGFTAIPCRLYHHRSEEQARPTVQRLATWRTFLSPDKKTIAIPSHGNRLLFIRSDHSVHQVSGLPDGFRVDYYSGGWSHDSTMFAMYMHECLTTPERDARLVVVADFPEGPRVIACTPAPPGYHLPNLMPVSWLGSSHVLCVVATDPDDYDCFETWAFEVERLGPP